VGDAAYLVPERTTVDGVPVFFLPVPGLLRAELIFRVGQVDEALPRRGITHLVEHLALHSRAHRPDWWRANATVEPYVTRFSVRGAPDDISSFISDVTTSLSELPIDRLPAELAVLRTEAVNAGGGSIREIWSHRFGARGLGVSDYLEFGLKWLGASDVRAWAEERFNAGNAVLWVSGELPRNLRLNLRPGKRFPRPQVKPLDHATPAFYHHPGNTGVALSMLSKAGITTRYLVSEVLDDRVRKRLRHAESLAYDARVSLQAGGIAAFADSLAENAGQAAASLIAVVRELAELGHRPDELEMLLASTRAARQEPGAALESLIDAAFMEVGAATSIISWDDYDKEAEALTAADVALATEAALSTALLAIPEGAQCDIEGFTPLPVANGLVFVGNRLMGAPGAGHDAVIDYSDEGISIIRAGGMQDGIEWQDIAAALWWNDGTRALVALDGAAHRFVPSEWDQPEALLEAIRVHVPQDRWVPMDGVGPHLPA
jgi:zinc protease